jgi:hypothetical protein
VFKLKVISIIAILFLSGCASKSPLTDEQFMKQNSMRDTHGWKPTFTQRSRNNKRNRNSL